MARLLTPTDAHTVLNAIAYQATGRSNLVATDTSSFVSVGETVLRTGTENVLSALTLVIGRTLVAVRPYTAKISLIQEEDYGLYTTRMRKISFYDKDSVASGWVNTNLYSKNLYNGYSNTQNTDAVGSMYEQSKPIAIEMNFGGSSVWDFVMTFYEDQLKTAFRSEADFIAFWNGTIMQKQNEIETVKEQFNRMNMLNFMGGLLNLNSEGSVVNLTKSFNDYYGTSYTNDDLLSTHIQQFLEFMTSEIKLYSDYMTERSSLYHWSPSKTVDGTTYTTILRHTPKDKQKLFYFKPLFERAKALVFPQIFNENYISMPNGEGVTFWQAIKDANGDARMKINVTPAIPDTTNPAAQKTGTPVTANVVALLFDTDALITNFMFEGADSTPLEARKKYRNTWFHNMKNAQNDFTENAIIFIMDDSYL